MKIFLKMATDKLKGIFDFDLRFQSFKISLKISATIKARKFYELFDFNQFYYSKNYYN